LLGDNRMSSGSSSLARKWKMSRPCCPRSCQGSLTQLMTLPDRFSAGPQSRIHNSRSGLGSSCSKRVGKQGEEGFLAGKQRCRKPKISGCPYRGGNKGVGDRFRESSERIILVTRLPDLAVPREQPSGSLTTRHPWLGGSRSDSHARPTPAQPHLHPETGALPHRWRDNPFRGARKEP
jgi:hypothetical protein